jgi:hypothetical protein
MTHSEAATSIQTAVQTAPFTLAEKLSKFDNARDALLQVEALILSSLEKKGIKDNDNLVRLFQNLISRDDLSLLSEISVPVLPDSKEMNEFVLVTNIINKINELTPQTKITASLLPEKHGWILLTNGWKS